MLAIPRSLEGAKRRTKLGIVLVGYALASIAGIIAAWMYDLRFSPADQQASGGMIAFGELTFGAGVFALLSVPPTALALWLVRRHRGTWDAMTIACLAFALLGVVGVPALLTASLETVRTPAIEVAIGVCALVHFLPAYRS